MLKTHKKLLEDVRSNLLFYLNKKNFHMTASIMEQFAYTTECQFNTNIKEKIVGIKEYIKEEKKLFPSTEEVKDFFDNIKKINKHCKSILFKIEALKL